jgi:GxxExxY protein
MKSKMEYPYQELTERIIGCSIDIHKALGPGLLESVYKRIFAYELEKIGWRVRSEIAIPLEWDGQPMEMGFRADRIVNNEVLLELKSVEVSQPVHRKQVLTYLRITQLKVRLLINFGEVMLKNGIHRLVN